MEDVKGVDGEEVEGVGGNQARPGEEDEEEQEGEFGADGHNWIADWGFGMQIHADF